MGDVEISGELSIAWRMSSWMLPELPVHWGFQGLLSGPFNQAAFASQAFA